MANTPAAPVLRNRIKVRELFKRYVPSPREGELLMWNPKSAVNEINWIIGLFCFLIRLREKR
jgi:hypothetical protein